MYVLETVALTKKFADFTAVNNLSLKIEKGSIYGFLGSNGSGKSTTIRMLCGVLLPTSGTIKILDKDLSTNLEFLKNNIGYMSQKFSLHPDLTVLENLHFYAGLYNLSPLKAKQRITEIIELAGVENFINELTCTLSGGWRQRLALGCAILHKPALLFLDEPTSGVDPTARRMFWGIIHKLIATGTTILITTHFMDEAEHCNNITFIHQGRTIATGSPQYLKTLIPYKLWQITTADPLTLQEQLVQENCVFPELYVRGKQLRVLSSMAPTAASLNNYIVEEIQPSLEDVFVYLIKQERRKIHD